MQNLEQILMREIFYRQQEVAKKKAKTKVVQKNTSWPHSEAKGLQCDEQVEKLKCIQQCVIMLLHLPLLNK